MKILVNENKSAIFYHILYWCLFIIFFSIVWGTYDNDYFRNFMIQVLSLPARLVLVYGTILFLFPFFFSKDKLVLFVLGYIILLIFCTVFIQRSMMIFVIEGAYLPYNSKQYFNIIELTNTLMDVNITAIFPVGSKLVGHWMQSRKKLDELKVQNQKLSNYRNQFLLFKKGSSKHKIFLHEIIFLESLKNNIKVITFEKEQIFYGSISNLEKTLKDQPFKRVHRSFIVNLNYIESFAPTNVVVKGFKVPIGRKYKTEVIKALKR